MADWYFVVDYKVYSMKLVNETFLEKALAITCQILPETNFEFGFPF